MKNLLQNTFTPLCLFGLGLLLLGCDQASHTNNNQNAATEEVEIKEPRAPQELKSGNMIYIVRDIADFQLQAGSYIKQLQQTQQTLQNAVNAQDHTQLQATAQQLKQQLTGFNGALNLLDLKSQEINEIRKNIVTANQKVLASPYLNGQVDLTQVDLKNIEQQIGSVQSEMLKLASLFISGNEQTSDTSEKKDES